MESLVSAWRQVADPGPLIFPGDREILDAHADYTVLHESFAPSCEDPLFWLPDGRFHVGLMPLPYLGNPEEADIFLLMMNPSFSYCDYVDEKLPEYRSLLFKNIHQRAVRGFPFLDPLNSRYSGGEYWLPRFTELARCLESKAGSFKKALKLLANRVAILELVPYRASSLGLPPKAIDSLESLGLMRAFAHQNLAPRAVRGEVLVIVTRKVDAWGLEPSDNLILYKGGETRGGRVSLGTRGGKAILSFLSR